MHARDKLVLLGDRLPFPHQSAVRGAVRLRELRPRAGRSLWRGIYARIGPGFVVLAVGPEARRDPQGFQAALARAHHRLAELEGL